MPQNIYDDDEFFAAYGRLPRSIDGLDGAPEWPTLRALVGDVTQHAVLDLGCGFGWFCRWAAASGAASVRGIDLSANMLARAAADTDDPKITYEQADLDAIELPVATYDLIYSSLTLHYLVDLPRLARTVHDALVPGGRFVFSAEHPIYTAPSDPEFVTSPGGGLVWPLDRYLVEGPRTTDWLAPGVVKHHRTIATYLRELRAAGFTLQDLVEWGPSDEQLAATPAWVVERDRPMFLLVASSR